VYCGVGWRTSLQIHQGNKNVKIKNVTIRQNHTHAHAAFTIHGRGAGGENRDILVDGVSIYSQTGSSANDTLGGLQMLGPTLNARFTNNFINSSKNGLYLPDPQG